MTVTTIFAQASDGSIDSESGTYSIARAGTGTIAVLGLGDQLYIGQRFPASVYHVYESFLSFDTSVIPDDDTVTAVSLQLFLAFDASTVDFTMEVRTHDFGTTLETADWVAGASLSALTNLANLASSGIGAAEAYKSFTSVGAAFNSAINKTGTTRMIIASSRTAGNNAPTGNEYCGFYAEGAAGTTKDPKLVITHSPPTQTITLNQATETNISQAFGKVKHKTIAQSIETNIAQAFNKVKHLAIQQAFEIDSAGILERFGLLKQAFETDIAQSLTVVKHREILQVIETNEAFSFIVNFPYSLFVTPTRSGAHYRDNPLMDRLGTVQQGITIWRDATGTWHEMFDGKLTVPNDLFANRIEFYQGGREYRLTDVQKTDLIAAGYGAYIVEH